MKIKGHYGTNTCELIEVDEGVWELTLLDYSEHCRFGIGESREDVLFVDPSGGPYIVPGMKLNQLHRSLPDKPITSIRRNGGIFLDTN